MQIDDSMKAGLNGIINQMCKSRERHDKILTRCVRDTVQNPMSKDPIKDFASYLSRRLLKNESVVVNMLTLGAAFARDKHAVIPVDGLQQLHHWLSKQPLTMRLESNILLGSMLVCSRHAFRVMEISHDIWRVLNPDATPEQRERSEYLANITHVSENLTHMGLNYSGADIIDCLNLIADSGAFYLRAGFLFRAAIEPMPFSDKLESLGFSVNILIDETETQEDFKEHDILKRLQGFLITKNADAMTKAMQHVDFLQELTREIPLPATDLAKPLQLG